VTLVIDPSAVAKSFRQELREQIKKMPEPLRLIGFLSSDYPPSITYSTYTKTGCDDVGIQFELRRVDRLKLEQEIEKANDDETVHGIIIYYPVFGSSQDDYIKDVVKPEKDVEGLHTFWTRKLYHNDRYVDAAKIKKALLPCTPLAIVKLLEISGEIQDIPEPLRGKKVTIFNRSEVVGRPLASMLSNDGAEVYSFDVSGPIGFRKSGQFETKITRKDALAVSDIVITGVPSREFPLVSAKELKKGVVCINFSTFKNFSDDVQQFAKIFIPRVGPMTVTMVLRNTLRLHINNLKKD
jgi:methylenetetrahydrofolate dehydrogenase (NADP+)/methenyltetrahydrofolate cyclohydrolase